MLDEIDKIGSDFRGDPAAALLEVLDPEQNVSFRDHYLGVAYDLSKVMFITTGNLIEPIPPAFLDRMEVIRLAGYTQAEKLEIATRHLVPRQIEENGLEQRHVSFTRQGLERIIADYTREAGVRNLEREIASICRKVAMRVARGNHARLAINAERLKRLLGPPRHHSDELLDRDRVGVATGLAWTAAGGDLMLIEALSLPGRGQLTPDRPARRGDEGVGAGGSLLRALVRGGARPRRSPAPARRAHPRAGGLDPQGRALRRRDHRHRDRLPAARDARCAGASR